MPPTPPEQLPPWPHAGADVNPHSETQHGAALGHRHQDHGEHGDDDQDAVDNVLAGHISENELAKQLGLTARTLWRWRRQRRGPDVTVIGRQIWYSRDAVARWLEQRERRMVREGRRSKQNTI